MILATEPILDQMNGFTEVWLCHAALHYSTDYPASSTVVLRSSLHNRPLFMREVRDIDYKAWETISECACLHDEGSSRLIPSLRKAAQFAR